METKRNYTTVDQYSDQLYLSEERCVEPIESSANLLATSKTVTPTQDSYPNSYKCNSAQRNQEPIEYIHGTNLVGGILYSRFLIGN